MQEQIKESEIEFMEFYSDPTAMTECLIPENINSPQTWPNCNCMVDNTKILMSDYTTKNIQDIAIGDEILTFKEHSFELVKTKVINKILSGVKNVIEIKTQQGSTLYCTKDHKIKIKQSHTWAWSDARKTFGYEVVRWPHTINNLNEYYEGQLFGFIDSDGSFYNSNNRNILVIYQKIETKAVEFLLKKLNLDYYKQDCKNGNFLYRLKFGKKYGSLEYYNMLSNKLDDNKDFQLGYICGFLLGDGHFDKHNKSWIISQKKVKQIERLEKTFAANGIALNMWHSGGITKYYIPKYVLPFLNPCSVKIKKFWKSLVNRKLVLSDQNRDKVVSIKDVQKQRVWDLETEAHTFIANNILVHNCLTLRPYQFAMQNYSYMIAENPALSQIDNLTLKKISGDLYSIGARNLGKSLWLWIDTVLTIIHKVKEACVASFDDQHLKKVTNTISLFVESHKFLQIFHLSKETSRSKTVKRSPFEVVTEHGSVVKGINEKVEGDNPGTAFHGLHFDYLNYEEFCVDGKTQIRWVDEKGNIHSDRIVRFIDSGDWKNALVYSYNFKEQKIELKKVSNIFQKNVKNYGVWDLKFETFGNTKYRRLITSQHQKIWTDSGYKEVEDISKDDTFYTFDYYKLTDIQKQITIGTLLGDACVSQKVKGKCLPSMHFVHSISQEDYIQYKKKCFLNLFQSFHRQKNKTGFNYQETNWGGKTLHGTTDTCVDLYEFLDFKKNGNDKKTLDITLLEKYMSEISLAFWVMDDGILLGNKGKTENTKYIRINTQGFNYQSHLFLKEILKKKFNLDVQIREENRFNKKYFTLQFDNKNTLLLIDKIKKYVHPTLYYKIYTKIELCSFLYNNIKPNFIDLSQDVKDLLQPIKLLSKEFIIRRTWKMHDIEVEDNHNFFAGGTLISNSYASDQGAKKRVDSGNSLGYIERLSGIPDLCIGSPMGKILKDARKQHWIWKLPQFVREDYSEEIHQKLAEEHGGEKSTSFRLNVEAITLEGAYGFWDMARLKEASLKKTRRIKCFEIDKETFADFSSRIHIDRLAGSEQCFIIADMGFGSAPTEIIILFFNGKKYIYSYNITLYRLVREEQAEIFYWLYKQLNGGFIGIDATSDDGETLEYVHKLGVPRSHLLKVKLNENIETGFQRDESGEILFDRNGNPLMQLENSRQFAFQELEKLMYNELMEIPYDEKFLNQFTSTIAKQTKGMKTIYENKSSADHLHSAFEIFAIVRFLKEFETIKGQKQSKRAYCSFTKKRT
jgi:hypothetical protein